MKCCPECDTENEDFFSFCLGCGHDLEGGVPEAKAEPAPVAAAADDAPESEAEPAPVAAAADDAPESEAEPAPVAAAADDAPESEDDAPESEAELAPVAVEEEADDALSVAAEVTPPGGVSAVVDEDVPEEAEPSGVADAQEDASVDAEDVGEDAAVSAEPGLPAVESDGAAAAEDDGLCPACDAPVDSDAAYCVMCGTEVALVRAASTRRPVQEAPLTDDTTRGALLLVAEDGSLGERFPLYAEHTLLGRDGGHINFPDDDFMSGRHAEFTWRDGVLCVHPLDTSNGIFLRITEEMELTSGASFRIGQELLRLDGLDDLPDSLALDDEETQSLGSPLGPDTWGRLLQLVAEGTAGRAFMLTGGETTLGRDRGDITFPGDGYVSGVHARLTHRDGKFFLADLDSSNGTYLRIGSTVTLSDGDHLLAGQQLFKFEA